MPRIEYVARIKGDASSLEKTIKEVQGKISRINDDEVLIKFNYDGNVKQFNKIFQDLLKKHPDLTVQLQYDLNKKFLEQETKKLEELETIKLSMDPSDIEGELTEVNNKIDKTKNNIELINKELSRLSASAPELQLDKQMTETLNTSNQVVDSINKIQDGVNEIGLSSGIDKLNEDVNEVNDSFEETAELINKISGLGNAVSGWAANKKETREHYTPYNTTTKEVASTELVGAESEITGALIKSAIEQSKIAVDGFIHTHPTKVAAFSDADIATFYKLAEEGITEQVVTSVEEAITLDMSKLDTAKSVEVVEELQKAYNAIDRGIEENISEDISDIISKSQSILSVIKANDPVSEAVIRNFEKVYPIKMQQLGEAMSFEEYQDALDEMITFVLHNTPEAKGLKMGTAQFESTMTSLNAVLDAMESAATNVMRERAQVAYQKVLEEVFSNPSYLKEGVSSALKIESISSFIDANSIKKAAAESVKAAKDAIKKEQDSNSPSEEAKELGNDFGQGYVEGIREKIPNAISAATELAEAAIEAVKTAQESHSPSEKTRKEGRNFGEGYVEGILEKADEVRKASEKVVSEGIDGLSSDTSDVVKEQEKFELAIVDTNNSLERMAELAYNASITEQIAKNTKAIEEENSALKEQEEFLSRVAEIAFKQDTNQLDSNKFDKIASEEITNILNKEEDALREVTSSYNSSVDAINGYISEIEKADVKTEEFNDNLKKIYETQKKNEGGSSLSLLNDLHEMSESSDKLKAKLPAIIESLEKLKGKGKTFAGGWTSDFTNEIDNAIAAIERLQRQDIISEEDVQKAREIKQAVEDASKVDTSKGVNEKTRARYLLQIQQYLQKNTKLSKETRASIEEIGEAMKKADNKQALSDLYTRLLKIEGVAEATGEAAQSMFTKISNRLQDMNSKFIAQFLSYQDVIRYVRQAVSVITELDYALVDLKKTTTMSETELKEFYYTANDTAKALGTTTEEIINQAAAWSRLGYSSQSAATEMAALSAQFAAISPGMDLDTATDGLVSTMKAFGYDVNEVEREIMDVINKTGNTMATTNQEIVEMLTRSSSAMAAANNTLKETTALESAAVQITRNAETTGTAFRTKNCPYVQQCA